MASNMTIDDIASALGVSKTTVSRLWGNTRPREDAHLYDVGKMMWEIKKDRGIL